MSVIWSITKKEFKSYFSSPIAYVFLVVFLILVNWMFFNTYFIAKIASMRDFFNLLPWIFLFFVPAVTMRLWAEEKKLGTQEILMTLPVKDYEVVIGKYLASFFFMVVAIVLTFSIPLILSITVDPEVGLDFGPIIGGYVGLFLMGAAYLAIGVFASSLSENQIIAFILGIVISFMLFILGESFVLMRAPEFLVPVFRYVGLGVHFDSIARGVIDSKDIVYYISLIAFFLFLNVRSVESRRWK